MLFTHAATVFSFVAVASAAAHGQRSTFHGNDASLVPIPAQGAINAVEGSPADVAMNAAKADFPEGVVVNKAGETPFQGAIDTAEGSPAGMVIDTVWDSPAGAVVDKVRLDGPSDVTRVHQQAGDVMPVDAVVDDAEGLPADAAVDTAEMVPGTVGSKAGMARIIRKRDIQLSIALQCGLLDVVEISGELEKTISSMATPADAAEHAKEVPAAIQSLKDGIAKFNGVFGTAPDFEPDNVPATSAAFDSLTSNIQQVAAALVAKRTMIGERSPSAVVPIGDALDKLATTAKSLAPTVLQRLDLLHGVALTPLPFEQMLEKAVAAYHT